MIKAIKDAEEECLDLKKGRGYRQIVLWLQFSIREMNDESKKKKKYRYRINRISNFLTG